LELPVRFDQYISETKHAAVCSYWLACFADFFRTFPVTVFRRETIWKGDVEVFKLTAHPKATRCYAWAERENDADPGARFFTVLELPPVVSAETAVQAAIVNDSKK